MMAQFLDSREDVFLVNGTRHLLYFPEISDNVEAKELPHTGCGMLRREIIASNPIPIDGRFFGFTAYQNELIKDGGKVMGLENIRFVALDLHPAWSRVVEYAAKGYGRNIVSTVPDNRIDDSIFNNS